MLTKMQKKYGLNRKAAREGWPSAERIKPQVPDERGRLVTNAEYRERRKEPPHKDY
jgi:hypothetical protein